MTFKQTLLKFAAVGLSFMLTASALSDEPPQASVSELVTALEQFGKANVLTEQLSRKLDELGAESDQLAAEVLMSMEKIQHNAQVRKYINALVEQKKERLAAQLLLRIKRAQLLAGPYGPIVIGQVVAADGKLDPELVMAQMPILAEGYFADVVKSFDQPLSFRAAGYRDLNVPLSNYRSFVAMLGKVELQPLPPEEQAALKGTVALDGSTDFKNAQVIVSVSMGPANTPHGGYSPRKRWPEAIKTPVSESGTFTVEGLNPGEVTVTVSSEGHMNQMKRLKLSAAQPTDVGELRLLKSDLGFYLGGAGPEGELKWETDYTAALKRAEVENKPLMVMMTATWCGPCKMLEKETLNDPWIRLFLSRFVIVKAYEDKEVEAKYGTSGYPTLVFADSSGKQAYRCMGHKPAYEFARDCAQAFKSLGIEQPDAIKTLIDKKIVTLR